jgi:glycosyltransferase involved in cell wall biosynthesis
MMSGATITLPSRSPESARSPRPARKICYVLKRFPRLSETFILNEIRALERLGVDLTIVSLLPREAGLHHAAVSEVRAPVYYLPPSVWGLLRRVGRHHLALIVASPGRYLRTAMRALWLGIRYLHPAATFKNFTRAVILAARCREEQVTHLHAHFANTPTRVAFFISTLTGIPFSFTAHAKDLYLSTQQALIDRLTGADFVVTCTRYNAEYLKRSVPSTLWPKIHVVYHGVDLSAFFQSTNGSSAHPAVQTSDTPLILSVGRLVPKKGMPTLVAACGRLRDRGLAFRCQIIGTGPLRADLERQIDRLLLGGIVKLRGAMTHDALIDEYSRATLFALTPEITADGDRDGIPNVLVEAMAAGVPVVSTAISGIPELIEPGRTGVLVEPREPDAVADALEQLLCSEPLRRRLAMAARDRVIGHFECWESAKAIRGLFSGSES